MSAITLELETDLDAILRQLVSEMDASVLTHALIDAADSVDYASEIASAAWKHVAEQEHASDGEDEPDDD